MRMKIQLVTRSRDMVGKMEEDKRVDIWDIWPARVEIDKANALRL
jgi:hypothetical protein